MTKSGSNCTTLTSYVLSSSVRGGKYQRSQNVKKWAQLGSTKTLHMDTEI